MKIDAHQHFWQYEAQKHAWIDESMQRIRQDFMPDDLWPLLQAQQIDGCVAVQADQSEDETRFLLDLAQQHDFIKGVVGWIDLRSSRLAERLDHYQDEKKLVGFRHVVQGEADVNFMLRPDFLRGLQLLQERGYTYDILIFPHQLGAALELVRRMPEQAFVIDHIAKPYIKDGFYDGWGMLMCAIADFPNVHCKISGMLTEADWKHWEADHFDPYIDLVLDIFGAERLMYGSDWPVCLLAGEYEAGLDLLRPYLAKLSESEQAAIMGGSASKFYGL
ncbi:MAG: amidohydrolase family protein [Bacteroidota bacterium]